MLSKLEGRARRKGRIRKRVAGSVERPRLTVFRSARHLYAQVIDDRRGLTLASVSTLSAETSGSKRDKAKVLGEALAKACVEKGIRQVVFDRNGYLYHGRVRALADGAREGGLDF